MSFKEKMKLTCESNGIFYNRLVQAFSLSLNETDHLIGHFTNDQNSEVSSCKLMQLLSPGLKFYVSIGRIFSLNFYRRLFQNYHWKHDLLRFQSEVNYRLALGSNLA